MRRGAHCTAHPPTVGTLRPRYTNIRVVLGNPWVQGAVCSAWPRTCTLAPLQPLEIPAQGMPLPLAVLGPSVILTMGTLAGLRATNDVLPLMWASVLMSLFHIWKTMEQTPAARLNYITVVLSYALILTVAFLKTEFDLRQLWAMTFWGKRS